MSTLFIAIPSFMKVGLFVFLVYILLALFGLHFYGAGLYNRCRFNPVPETPTSWAIDETISRVCTKSGEGFFHCPKGRYCGNPYDYPGLTLASDQVINDGQIFYGITTFANIGSAIFAIHHMISLDSWSYYVYNLIDLDFPIVAVFYGLVIVIFGSYVVMNLILAVIIDTFIQLHEEDLKKEMHFGEGDLLEIHVDDDDIVVSQFMMYKLEEDIRR